MIDLVLISTLKRMDLFQQTIDSLAAHVSTESNFSNFVIVLDNPELWIHKPAKGEAGYVICTQSQYGASRCRNIGASSIPKYLRGKYVCFCDDDLYFCPGWDAKMLELAEIAGPRIMSGCAHPFNHAEEGRHPTEYGWKAYGVPLVISTPHFMMPWEIWDDVGYFTEPGGPGGSEDYDYCVRARDKGYGFAVTEPQCVIHTGITSSSGKPIVGADLVKENNAKLERVHGIEGKVAYL